MHQKHVCDGARSREGQPSAASHLCDQVEKISSIRYIILYAAFPYSRATQKARC